MKPAQTSSSPELPDPPPESAQPPSLPEGEPNHSPLLILFGLVVVWGSLYLVAVAQNLSYAPAAVPVVAASQPLQGYAAPPGRNADSPLSSMLVPVESMNLKEIPARQLVKDLLYKAHLHINSEELDKIGSAVRDIHFEDKPLYECLYSAVDADTLGLMVVDDHVRFVPQRLTHQFPDQGPLEQFNWDADLQIDERAASLFPSGRSDLWVRLRLLPSEVAPEPRVLFEIFRLGVREGMGEAILPAAGSGALRFVTGSTLSLHIENRREVGTADAVPPREVPIGVRLQYQSLGAIAEDESPQETPLPEIEATDVKTPVES